ncbi:MAG: hypothetical protein DSY37_02310, partial [Hyperthermus sp.]
SKIPIKRRPRKPMRMIHLKKRMKKQEAEVDTRLKELFQLREETTAAGEVVVQLTENSTCKTCEI